MANLPVPSVLLLRLAKQGRRRDIQIMLRAGVVGAGWVSSARHLPSLVGADGVDIVGVYDRKIERARAAAPNGAVGTDDLDARLDMGLDMVSVCTPPAAHANDVITALGRGVVAAVRDGGPSPVPAERALAVVAATDTILDQLDSSTR